MGGMGRAVDLLERVAMLVEGYQWDSGECEAEARLIAKTILALPEIREGLGLREWVGEPELYARDLDGTGSLHVCAKGDSGAVPLYR